MKAGQLARILQSVEPNTEVSFSVFYESDDRERFLSEIRNDPDALTEMVAKFVEIDEVLPGHLRVDISVFPTETLKK